MYEARTGNRKVGMNPWRRTEAYKEGRKGKEEKGRKREGKGRR